MHVFNYNFLRNASVDADILNRATSIERIRGGIPPLSDRLSRALERRAVLMSVIDSNDIEGIRTSEERMIKIINNVTASRGQDEEEIAGYRDALRYIHSKHSSIVLDKKEILNIYGMLMMHTNTEPAFKTRDNVIIERDIEGNVVMVHSTVPSEQTERCIDQMLYSFWEARNDADINKLLLIPCFIMDFLRIHPFIDGNGRMSRLLTILLLYQEGYEVCRYTSIESKINASKSDYYTALEESEIGWFENECDYGPFIRHFLDCLFLCYRELNLTVGSTMGRNGTGDSIKVFMRSCYIHVSKKDICMMFPEVSETTVERVLKKMCDSGEIIKVGESRATRYIAKR